MNILFLSHSANLGGAELCLFDIVNYFNDAPKDSFADYVLVGLLADGPLRIQLEACGIPVEVLTADPTGLTRAIGFPNSIGAIKQVLPAILPVAKLAKDYDLIYANTPDALMVGAMASVLSRRPLIFHLHDIVTQDYFSQINQGIIVNLANTFASLVIANSKATKAAFVDAGGRAHKIRVVYNGFNPTNYQVPASEWRALRQELGLENKFVVGHFNRLTPRKGQHLLLEALLHCPEDVAVLLVGDKPFDESEYVDHLHHLVDTLHFGDRVKFLGFRADIPQLMSACDLVVHTSTIPEPFVRPIVEAMFCERPVVAAAAGGAIELLDHGKTGWLCPPSDPYKLSAIITTCHAYPEHAQSLAQAARIQASHYFALEITNRQIANLLREVVG